MLLEQDTYRQLSEEIAFVDRKITDYFSPKGNFPEEMYLSKELGDTACRIPQGYTEQELGDLLLAVSCSDDCMDHTIGSDSTSSKIFEDPRKNAIVSQVGMVMSNSLTKDDFSRQKGISEAYLNGRKKINELVSQLEQGNTAQMRKLVSSGIKNMILSDRILGRNISAKSEAYATNRMMEMAMELLEKHPELRDPEILNDEDMDDFRIFRGRSAFYKDVHDTTERLLEKLKRGEDLTEEEIAEVIFLNQVQGASEKFEQKLGTYLEQEVLKGVTLPGGLPMPIGQNLAQLELGNYQLEISKSLPTVRYAGTGEIKEYTDKIRGKVQGIRTAEGYSNFTRAICIGYPRSKQKLLEKVRQSEYFKQAIKSREGSGQILQAEILSKEAEDKADQEKVRLQKEQNDTEKKLEDIRKAIAAATTPEEKAEREQAERQMTEQLEQLKQAYEKAEQERREASDKYWKAKEKAKPLRGKLDEITSHGVFSEEDVDGLLADEGISKKEITYKAETNPKNKEYVEALEAQRSGVNLKTDKEWQKIFAQQKQEIERQANDLVRLNRDHKAFNDLSYKAVGAFGGSKEAWLKKIAAANEYDPVTELLRTCPGQVFTLDENGQKVILNPAGSDLREMETNCLKAGTENGLYFMAPADSENPGAVYGMTFDRNTDSYPRILPIGQYLERLNQATMPEKPSWFVRFFAFLIPGFREKVQKYERDLQERAKAEKITENMGRLQSQPEPAQKAQNSETAENLKNLAEGYRQTAQELDPERTVENLKKLLNNGETEEAITPELVTLALINSVNIVRTPENTRENTGSLTKLLTWDGTQPEEADPLPDALQKSYEELLQRKRENKPLLPVEKLLSFYETVMQPELNLQLYKKCACLLAAIGENGLQQAMQTKKELPPAMKGLMAYGGLSREAVQICIRETEKALADPQARPSGEDIMTVLLCDTLDRDHLLGETTSKLHRDKKTQLLYTPMLRKIGKDGMNVFRTEVGISMGEDYFRQWAERGSAVLVSSHRKELGLSTRLETREAQAEEARKTMQNRQQSKDSMKK